MRAKLKKVVTTGHFMGTAYGMGLDFGGKGRRFACQFEKGDGMGQVVEKLKNFTKHLERKAIKEELENV